MSLEVEHSGASDNKKVSPPQIGEKIRLTVLLSENESVPIHPGRHYLKSLSGDPAEPVDEVAYLHEVEREAREFFCHEHFNVTHELNAADINLTLQISQVACS